MYETEEQQVEALKKWWHENGKSIIAGVVLGLGAVLGWQGWSGYKDKVGAEASNLFDQMLVSVRQENLETASKQRELLHQNYASTPYTAFADMVQAKLLYRKGDIEGARLALQQAIDTAPDEAFRSIAVLRLARIHLDTGDAQGAASVLSKYPSSVSFNADYAVLRGDIARDQGDNAAARQAYRDALNGNAGNTDLVQLKLNNLPPAS